MALSADIRWWMPKASPLGEVGGVGFVCADIVPEPFSFAQDKLREWDAVDS
jgi:hypothetical protein